MRKYFGTDGIRGRVGESPVTADFMLKLGWAAGRVLGSCPGDKVVIGKDTRISGYMFESALEAGLSAAGMDVHLLGPTPTPGVAYLTRTLGACAGIVISASHNPYYDNGIKFFSSDGRKLPDELELAIEAEIDGPMETVDSARLGKARRVEDAAGRYIEFCKGSVPRSLSLRGLRLVVDCAHGATYHIAPKVFRELGAEVFTIGSAPDGLNINRDCGSTQPAALQEAVREQHADLGIALDGDGDRVILVDHRGELVDGDQILYIIASALHRAGAAPSAVVGTVMSNLGLEHALGALGIGLYRTPVGDRHVLEKMLATDCELGGESSGHLICLSKTTTGDGIISALQVLRAMVSYNAGLAELASGMTKYPQKMINVPVRGRVDLDGADGLQSEVRAVTEALSGRGRVLLRASGTEPVVRVMVEGRDAELIERHARHLAECVETALGA